MGRRAEARYPVALAKISASRASDLLVERRIGRFVGRASSPDAFVAFRREVSERARESLTSPTRMLTLPHLKNSVAGRIEGLESASRDLIEGYIFQLVKERLIVRLPTVSRNMMPYQALYWHQNSELIGAAIASLCGYIASQGSLTLSHAKRILPDTLAAKDQHIEILFGHLLYLGIVSTDAAPAYPLDNVRAPYVAPRL